MATVVGTTPAYARDIETRKPVILLVWISQRTLSTYRTHRFSSACVGTKNKEPGVCDRPVRQAIGGFMRETRRWGIPVTLAGSFALAVFSAAPAAADVDCADLASRAAAQSYLDGNTGDPDRLDSDADGQACEGNDPAQHGTWLLLGLGVLLAAGLVRFSTDAGRQARSRPVVTPVQLVPAQVSVSVQHVTEADASIPVQKQVPVFDAPYGSLTELARALRLVPYASRMKLLEEHARAEGSEPQDVLDALAEQITDLELQGWALAGYDPPWTVRPMYCDCVGGLRNYRLQRSADGSRFWACASCHAPVRQA